jgi:hypothetical protein
MTPRGSDSWCPCNQIFHGLFKQQIMIVPAMATLVMTAPKQTLE